MPPADWRPTIPADGHCAPGNPRGSECFAAWYLAGKRKLRVLSRPEGRPGHPLELLIKLPDGDVNVEVKAPLRRITEEFWWGDDSDVLQGVLKTANGQFKAGRYVTPFDPDSRVAPMPAADIARVAVGILENPGPHIGQAYQLNGPVEYSHVELAKTVGQVLGKPIENDRVKGNHMEAARIDQQEGLLSGTGSIGARIIGRPLMTIEEFINENRSLLL